jgi:putative tributyrin esterase
LTERSGFASFEVSGDGAGSLEHATVTSAALHRRADVSLLRTPGEGHPVLVILLHGVYGSHWSWAANGGAVASALAAAQENRPLVIAMPSDGLWGIGSGYAPHHGENAEVWIAQEVPRLTEVIWPDVTGPFAIAGLSMGGYGALRIAARYPGSVRAAIALSPLDSLNAVAGFTGRPDLSPDGPGDYLVDLLADTGTALPPFRIRCGSSDPLAARCREMVTELAQRGIAADYYEAPGGHDWTYWSAQLPDLLGWILAG